MKSPLEKWHWTQMNAQGRPLSFSNDKLGKRSRFTGGGISNVGSWGFLWWRPSSLFVFSIFRVVWILGSFCVQHSLFPLYAALSWIFAPPQPHNRVGCQKASVGRAEKSSLEYGWLHWCWLMVLTMMEKTCQMTFCQCSWNVLVVWHVK